MLYDEIREHLIGYLSEEASLQDFDFWFAPATRNFDKLPDAKALELADEIEELLAGFTSEQVTEDELRTELRELLAPPAAE